ncbi:hypothetical protein [Agromyces sp. PvR057]|uniref:hypothetical protein n=1 Tax=Agromyces sp. PvR057 TaxID=3156403 RepID=UPI000E278FFB
MSGLERRPGGGLERRPAGASGGAGDAGAEAPRGLFARLFAKPTVRAVLARVVVVVGAVFMVAGLLTARYGYLVVGVIVVGLGAALGPGRLRR